ncbi:hypothetical protein [Streptomyces sp. NPDC088246]
MSTGPYVKTGRPVGLLRDREAAIVLGQLTKRPGIEFVCRARAQ